MSDDPQPLRLKPRPPSGGEAPPPPPGTAPAPAAADSQEGAGKLRLKPRLNLAEDPARAAQAAPAAPGAAAPLPSPEPPPAPTGDDVPVFKLRPKKEAAPPPVPAAAPLGEEAGLPPPPEPFAAPPEPLSDRLPPPPPPPGVGEGLDLPPPPPPPKGPGSMPPMSVLSAPPPPPPGAAGVPDPPAPGAVPKLSMASKPAAAPAAAPPAKSGLNLKVTAVEAPKGGKPPVPGKPPKGGKVGAVLRKRAALGPLAKAGVAVAIVALSVAGIFFYRIFFPPPSPVIAFKPIGIKKVVPKDAEVKAAPKPTAAPKPVEAPAAKTDAKEGAPADAQDAQSADGPGAVTILAQTNLATDVKVNSNRVEAAPAASAAFRTFVAGATIGGVFQGHPSRALINGAIVKEGQMIDGALNITFDRIDAARKIIYFKDSTGAEVSKSY